MWDVPRAQWAAYVDYYEKNEKPVMEKLIANGTIVDFGFESTALHDPDGYSHASWFSAYSLAGLEEALNAFYEEQGQSAAQIEAELAGMITKHKDVITQSDHYGLRTSKFSGGYSVGSFVQLKPGKGPEFFGSFAENGKPIYEKLLADGTIASYVVSTELFHTSEPGGVWMWYVAKDIQSVEKAEAAFEKQWAELSRSERNAAYDQRRDMTEGSAHRDGFTRIIHYQAK
jgi:hypothetical protein